MDGWNCKFSTLLVEGSYLVSSSEMVRTVYVCINLC
jgi:hypothetical protein